MPSARVTTISQINQRRAAADRSTKNGRARPLWPLTSRRRCLLAWGAVVAAAVWYLELRLGVSAPVQIIRKAVCTANAGQVDCNSSGLGGITTAADDLISPILVALFAISPIACLIGVGAMMVGNRRGIVIIASALGALVLAGAVKGIVA